MEEMEKDERNDEIMKRCGVSREDIDNAIATGHYNPFALGGDVLGIGTPGQGGGQGWGAGHRTPRKAGSTQEIDEIVASVSARADLSGPERAALLAKNLIGFSESGGANRGAIVSFSCADGLAWCGGFINRITEITVPGVYNGITNPLLANNWADYARGYSALHGRGSHYTPQPGDVICFDRHVGIVTAVNGGKVTYVSGNYSDMAEAVTFDLNSPPPRFTGFADTQAIARARGINLATAPGRTENHAGVTGAETTATPASLGISGGETVPGGVPLTPRMVPGTVAISTPSPAIA